MKHTTVLIFEHAEGQSTEGAIKLRNDVDAFAATLGLETVGASTTPGDGARGLAMRMIMEGDDDL
jgi:hypothetical protein